MIDDAGGTPSTITPGQRDQQRLRLQHRRAVLATRQHARRRPTSPAISSGRTTTRPSHETALPSISATPNKVTCGTTCSTATGPATPRSPHATNDLGNGFSPLLLGTTAAAAASNLGNFVGNPAFVFPIDPRPGSDGPANFFIDADFQLTAVSAAIDNAWEATAIPTDFLGNYQVKINGRLGLPGYGPRDVGAFEFDGTGGDPVGGAFRVVTTTLVPVAGETYAKAGPLPSPHRRPRSPSPSRAMSIPADINATDLVLSGSALNRRRRRTPPA